MKSRTFGCLSLILALSWISPSTHAQQLVKRMKCADFFIIAPITHRSIGSETKQITIQIVRDTCRPKFPEGYFVVQKTGPGPGGGPDDAKDAYGSRGWQASEVFAPEK